MEMESQACDKTEENAEKRVLKSRPHTKEEKKEQKKRYRKRKREKKRSEIQESHETRESKEENEAVDKPLMEASRAAIMVNLAKKRKLQREGTSLNTSNLKSTCESFDSHVKKQTQTAAGIKEIRPEFLEYSTLIGSGSYGDCYFAKYRGIEVVVKRGRARDSSRESKRVMEELIHEGHVIDSLGDHRGLPLLFGMVTKTLPVCLVLQFHGTNTKSLTLYRAAEEKLLSKNDCLCIFHKICNTLEYVHHKGFLHNDIKSNNVVLEEERGSPGYFPILIDFGKSRKIASYIGRKLIPRCKRSYLAPEVVTGKESTASDVFSLGYMLKSVSTILGLFGVFQLLIARACDENPSQRISLQEFHRQILTPGTLVE